MSFTRNSIPHSFQKINMLSAKTTEISRKFLWYLTNRKWMNGVIMPMVNVKPVKLGKNVRMSFSRIGEVLEMAQSD